MGTIENNDMQIELLTNIRVYLYQQEKVKDVGAEKALETFLNKAYATTFNSYNK